MSDRRSRWRQDAVSGLVVLVPVLVTGYVVAWLITLLYEVPGLASVNPPFVRGIAVLAGLAGLILGTGWLMRTTAGAVLEATLDALVNHIPGLRIVYNASKIGIETVVDGTDRLEAPVRVETWPGLFMTGFTTGTRTADGQLLVFVPTAPNVTSGFVVELDPDDVVALDETVEDALVRVISCGFGGQSPDEESQRHDSASETAIGSLSE